MPMPNRNVEGNYRYAYQGQEKDPETGMEAFELRLWDARIGRWLTTDPAGQYASPYLGMGNNPISRIDPDGGMDGDPSCCPGDCCPNQNGINIQAAPIDRELQTAINTDGLMQEGAGFNASIYLDEIPANYTYGAPIFNRNNVDFTNPRNRHIAFSGFIRKIFGLSTEFLDPLRRSNPEFDGNNVWERESVILPIPTSFGRNAASDLVTNGTRLSWKNKDKIINKLPFPTRNPHFINKFLGRQNRGITRALLVKTYNNGRLYYNPNTKNFIRHLSSHKISIAITKPRGGTAITVFEGNPSPDWLVVKYR